MSTEDERNPYPDGATVLARYPLPGQDYGEPPQAERWPWLPAEVQQRCGPDEWQVMITDARVAETGDGAQLLSVPADDEVFFPLCFRESAELMIREDDQADPDGPVTVEAPTDAQERERKLLAHEHNVLASQLSLVGISLGQWAGRGDWATSTPASRQAAGDIALGSLLSITRELIWFSLKLNRCGCATTDEFMQSIREGVLLATAADAVIKADAAATAAAGGQVLAGGQVPAGEAQDELGRPAATEQPLDPQSDSEWTAYFDNLQDAYHDRIGDQGNKQDQ